MKSAHGGQVRRIDGIVQFPLKSNNNDQIVTMTKMISHFISNLFCSNVHHAPIPSVTMSLLLLLAKYQITRFTLYSKHCYVQIVLVYIITQTSVKYHERKKSLWVSRMPARLGECGLWFVSNSVPKFSHFLLAPLL